MNINFMCSLCVWEADDGGDGCRRCLGRRVVVKLYAKSIGDEGTNERERERGTYVEAKRIGFYMAGVCLGNKT